MLVQLVCIKKKKERNTRSWLNIIYTLAAQCKNLIVQKKTEENERKNEEKDEHLQKFAQQISQVFVR